MESNEKFYISMVRQLLDIKYEEAAKISTNIYNIKDYIKKLYPDDDTENKLFNFLFRYKDFKFLDRFIYYMYKSIKDKRGETDKQTCKVYKLINNERKLDILFQYNLPRLHNLIPYRDNSLICFEDKLSKLSLGILNKISTELSYTKIIFLIELYMDKCEFDNIILKNKINSKNYENIITNIINNEEEIKFFKMIYQYFESIPYFDWYNSYKFMIDYKYKEGALKLFSNHFEIFHDYELRFDIKKEIRRAFYSLFEYMKTLEDIEKIILFLIDHSIPLSLFIPYGPVLCYSKYFNTNIKNNDYNYFLLTLKYLMAAK